MIRAGYGLFYTRIPQIYTSAIATDNGLTSANLILDNMDYYENQLFPTYPAPLSVCAAKSALCVPPSTVLSYLNADIAAFAPNFVTPRVHQASLNLERELADRFAAGISYMYAHGQNLIRARDINRQPRQTSTIPCMTTQAPRFLATITPCLLRPLGKRRNR